MSNQAIEMSNQAREMAKEDASVAIQNALHKLEQQPILLHNDENLKSVKSKLHRFSSRLHRFDSISKLTEVREVAYDAEDAMDDAIVLAAKSAHRRWRKLGNLVLFVSHKINHQRSVEEQLESIGHRTTSIDRSTCYGSEGTEDEAGSEGTSDDDDEAVVEPITPQEDLFKPFKLFYHSWSGFPAEVEIPARQLIQIWSADGFLDPQSITSMEEPGRDQINWLLKQGYITQAQKGTCGNVKTLKINKEKLDACIQDAKDADFLHVKIHKGKIAESEVSEIEESGSLTRLAIHNNSTSPLTGNDLRSFADPSKVRYLQIYSNDSNSNPLDCGSLKPFASLRVLDLGRFELETVPGVIGKLSHLRYLRLKAPKATKIPPSICKLPQLQTIDLKETDRVKMMPVEIWKMKKNLRHVHLGGATSLPPPQMANHYDALENLQTLCGVRPDKELKRLMVRAKFPNVNRLRLQCTNQRESEEFVSFLNSLDLLSDLRSLTLKGPIEKLPESNAFPSSMIKMTLWKTLIPAVECMETLEKVPNLRYLKLMEDSVTGKEMKCTGGGFPALELLRMEGLKDLESLTVEKGAMRLLRNLEVNGMEKLHETLEKLQREHQHMIINKDLKVD